ncbi:F/Y rich C-terminus [Popillia japonica]|uniref:F/Y rich C-terminus n=1 Tax=Popillia japonica TaxID=7064 RepID=A0AAW1L3L4_POPJA
MSDKFFHGIKVIKPEREPSKYKLKLDNIKQQIKEFVFENAALCDEISEIQEEIIIRSEERKFLLRKLCQYELQTEMEVEALSKSGFSQTSSTTHGEPASKKSKRKSSDNNEKSTKPRKSSVKIRKKLVQPIPLDSTGRPVFPIELGNLTIHSLGEVLSDRKEFHCEEAIYPVGYVSTRIYGSLKDPTVKCMYTCKISDSNGMPRFEIASDDNEGPIIGGTPDVCHSLLLQRINDVLSLNVVTTRPRGNDFFGLTHPTVLNLIQSSPGTRKCSNYKWSRFEVSKNGDQYLEDADATLNYDLLQRSIDFRKYKMAPDVLQRPSDDFLDSKSGLRDYII